MNLITLNLFSGTSGQLVVGTPKDIVCHRMTGSLDIKFVNLVVVDDVDMVLTSHSFISHFWVQLPTQWNNFWCM